MFGAKNLKFQKFSICAAVAAAAGTLREAGLGTAARGPLPQRPRLHKSKIFEILYFWLRTFWSEIGPNRARMDPEQTYGHQNLLRYAIRPPASLGAQTTGVAISELGCAIQFGSLLLANFLAILYFVFYL